MKIVCDSCATKYSISDDKVRGKVFKIRCKKCSHIIVVRGTTDASASAPAAAAPEGGGWHLVVDGDQVGPLPEAEIRARLARGEITGETYIWKEGFADWLKLSTVHEFSDVASAPAASELSGGIASDLFNDNGVMGPRDASPQIQVDEPLIPPVAAPSHGGGLFGAIDAAAASGPVISSPRAARASAAASAASGMEQNDVFGSPLSSRGGGGGDLFAAHAAQVPSEDGRRGAANHDGGRVENLTAQRHENSVLFSLANLQQLAMPTSSAKSAAPSSNGSSQSEGSGLIDIRAMAATTMGAPRDSRGAGGGYGDDLPAFGSFSSAAPVLLSMPSQSGPPKWIYAVIGAMAILVIGIGLMAYKILTTKPIVVEQPVAVPAPSAPIAAAVPPKAAAGTTAATAPGTAPAIADENLPPREGDAAAKAAADAASKHEKMAKRAKSAGPSGGGKEKKAPAEGGGKAAGAVAAPAPEPEKKAAKSSLDDLLESALSNKKARPRPSASDEDAPARKSASSAANSESSSSAGPLSKGAVVAGMNSVKPKVAECYSQFKVPGMAMVNVAIAKSGKVTSATVSGKFTGTPTGACVEKAVKSASFPPSDGLNTPYPFTLK